MFYSSTYSSTEIWICNLHIVMIWKIVAVQVILNCCFQFIPSSESLWTALRVFISNNTGTWYVEKHNDKKYNDNANIFCIILSWHVLCAGVGSKHVQECHSATWLRCILLQRIPVDLVDIHSVSLNPKMILANETFLIYIDRACTVQPKNDVVFCRCLVPANFNHILHVDFIGTIVAMSLYQPWIVWRNISC